VALACVVALLFFGSGSEAFLVEAPVALTGSLALGLVSILSLVERQFDARACWRVSILLLIGVMISVTGVVVAVWVGSFALAARGASSMIRCVAAPAVAFVGWFIWLGHEGGRVDLTVEQWLRVPESSWLLFSTPLGDLFGVAALGAPLTLTLVVGALALRPRMPMLGSLALAGIVAALTQAALSTVANLPYGLDLVLTSRYRYVILVLLLPALALVVNTLAGRLLADVTPGSRLLPATIALLLMAGVVVHGVLGQYRVGQFVAREGDEYRSLLRGTAASLYVGERLLRDSAKGSFASGEDLARLADVRVRDELVIREPSAEDRVAAEGAFFVSVSGGSKGFPKPARVESSSFTAPVKDKGGCATYEATSSTPSLLLTTYDGAEVRVLSQSSHVTTRLQRGDLSSDAVSVDVTPGEPVFVATSAQVAELEVTFDAAGTYTVCLPEVSGFASE
jgi:hypothetical protein